MNSSLIISPSENHSRYLCEYFKEEVIGINMNYIYEHNLKKMVKICENKNVILLLSFLPRDMLRQNKYYYYNIFKKCKNITIIISSFQSSSKSNDKIIIDMKNQWNEILKLYKKKINCDLILYNHNLSNNQKEYICDKLDLSYDYILYKKNINDIDIIIKSEYYKNKKSCIIT